ncbi:uncharacterized protein T551_00838 [Pneumocystis jirovecii RU7]|uniref:Uncharacterized protein n=1 Tax=Pneumocystis jirovecii (strain RU7) TaxID=1408657 RepID=A0A0W4ZUW1_PNEJ7|nr:uncharacterized protein T551_00838 [Pneumocystis jirovecii RU7]KTW32156.1 hypothetical protein T551_00838 [Pneumocystis jirovecii RU7]
MRKRHATIYDAVSDKIFPPHKYTQPSSTSELPRLRKQRPRGPDEYLKVTSTDWTKQLPNSELLQALNNYVANFSMKYPFPSLFESLDETALLALGILVEETVATLLGNGEKMFVEQTENVSNNQTA